MRQAFHNEREGEIVDWGEKSQGYDTVPISIADGADAHISYADENNNVEETLHKMSDAARRIAAFERRMQPHRLTPRASRLSPLHDISAEIQRHNTPSQYVQAAGSDSDHKPVVEENVSALWPWSPVSDADESDHDDWIQSSDPLKERQLPNSAEVARLEEEDMRRAIADGMMVSSQSTAVIPNPASKRLHTTFVGLVVLALLALTIDSVLVSMAFLRPHSPIPTTTGSPSITLSTSVVTYGQSVTLYIHHFTSSTQVYLTRDMAEPVIAGTGKSLVSVDKDGSAQTQFSIGSSWNPGFHTIAAEDIKTHYTANVTLRIAAGPTRPSHLVVSTTDIDLGAGIGSSNTIQPLTLQNAGTGTITWQASTNQSWLQITPGQGMFGSSQDIAVAGQRANLKPGNYQGVIILSSNVSAPQKIQVTMSVLPLQPHTGAILAVSPAVLSFSTQDGGSDPTSQPLTINNPGSQPLYWSVTNPATNASEQGNAFATPNAGVSWLNTDQTSGVIDPGTTTTIQVSAHVHNLLTGVYMSVLVFSTGNGHTAINSPQNVTVSLSVQPQCNLILNTDTLTFTSAAGQGNPSNQALNLSATTGCSAATTWHATSAASWLTFTPANGQLHGTTGSVIAIGVNTSGLAPHVYNTTISFSTASGTQTLGVQLTVQAAPPPGAPLISASPLNINFAATQGQGNLPPQTVTITNTGGSILTWRSSVNFLVSPWLGISPTGGTIPAKQTGQVTINVNPSKLAAGNYVGQVTLGGTDANGQDVGGSPQVITINLVVTPPCTLAAPSSGSLAFTALVGGPNPTSQSEVMNVSGNCNWPLNWQVNVPASASWLGISQPKGAFVPNKQSITTIVSPNISGLAPGQYKTQVAISVLDASNTPAAGSPQTFTVTLNVQQPCTLNLAPTSLTFSSSAAHPATAQTLQLSEIGACTASVNWQAQSSTKWLTVTNSGTDTGNGSSIAVSVNTSGLSVGTYKGAITVSTSMSGGTGIQNSPSTIPVLLTVA
jgi:Viral BACON domain